MTAIKVASFGQAVNVTLGLPFPRTSPDHGTALDIAGRGLARPDSLIAAIRLAGAAFLLGYAVLAARRALRPSSIAVHADGTRNGLLATVAACLALTWLNPHVYLDTVLLLGSVADSHGLRRWWFAAGAAVGSVLWFCALGYGARLLRPLFARPAAWRVLDVAIAAVMALLAVGLLTTAV